MFAIRLARECGRADVDQFLDELTPEQFDELYAAEIVANPMGREEKDVVLMCMQYNAALAQMAATGAKIKPEDWLNPSDFLHPGDKPKKRTMSSDEMKAVFKQRWGGG